MKRNIATILLALSLGTISLLPKAVLADEGNTQFKFSDNSPVILVQQREERNRSNGEFREHRNGRENREYRNNAEHRHNRHNRHTHMFWVPGHWQRVYRGHRIWIPGHWVYRF